MPKITPFLWFNDQAEEAMHFYVSLFKNSKVLGVTRLGKPGQVPGGDVLIASFILEGQEFRALNGGPHYAFNPAVSFLVDCDLQQEVDELWNKLSPGGEPLNCGWIKDKFGLVWQIVPKILPQMLQDKDPKKAEQVRQAMLQMKKIDIPTLQQAYNKP
jgi:predicted 3-demethylubiquinone-9 3-methyltransferase (glyoxalase superfamily)